MLTSKNNIQVYRLCEKKIGRGQIANVIEQRNERNMHEKS